GGDHHLEAGGRHPPATGLQAAVRVDPQQLWGDVSQRIGQQLVDLLLLRDTRGVDVPHTRANTQVVARLVQGGEHLHAVAGCLDGGDIRVEVADRSDELVELGVAHVGVDLSLRSHAGGSQAEGAHGPLQVRRLLSLAQRQQLADGRDRKSVVEGKRGELRTGRNVTKKEKGKRPARASVVKA